jgi:PKD repeat protein
MRKCGRMAGWWVLGAWVVCAPPYVAAETPYLYGIHDADPQPTEYLSHIKAQVSGGWVTATVAVGHNPNDNGGVDFSWYANRGHTVICRINNGYCPDGTIPTPDQYANFAQRCAKFVQNSPGCSIWVIGNETNLSSEWPMSNGRAVYVSPQSYADCFRACYNAIKAVRPTHKVMSQGLAPWGGPYGAGPNGCGVQADAMPLNWVQYLNQMLTAIKNSGGIDGIALHIPSRGYTYADIHSTQKVNAGGQDLYFSFYVYKDWVDLGIPPDLYHLPLYITECNGNYFWKGGHPENPAAHYEPGWMQEIYAEINRYNQQAATTGKPIFRCINMYRWCAGCDPWNIDGADNPYKGQILSDLDAAVASRYVWPESGFTTNPPTGSNLSPGSATVQTDSSLGSQWAGVNAIDGVVSVASKWVSQNTAPPHWIAVDLGPGRTVTGFIVRLPGAAGELTSYNARAFSFQIADSLSGPWTTEVTVDNSAQANTVTRSYVVPKAARHVRLHITDTGIDNYARIPEFEVWGMMPSPPVANFAADKTSGDAPLTVRFTDQSTSAIDTWSWTFGDGGQSTAASPSHTYAAPGTYTVSLTVTGPGGSDTRTRTDYITAVRVIPGDFDRDGDVDLSDFSIFQLCFNGPNRAPSINCPVSADLDGDSDVDLSDFGTFQSCFNGPNRPPACE